MGSLDVLCFGGEDWWYHNRAHVDMQLMRRMATRGTTLYVNSLVMQKPRLQEGRLFVQKLIRKVRSISSGLRPSDAGFWVYSPFSFPVHHIKGACELNVALLQGQLELVMRKLGQKRPLIWVACPPACPTALRLRKGALVYQRTDRFEEFPGVDSQLVAGYDTTMKREADLTLFVNQTLYEEEQDQCRRAIYLDHGVDFETFSQAEQDKTIPKDIADLSGPIVGFFGGIAPHTTDMKLIREVVDQLPDLPFVFVGSTPPEFDADMSTRPNVRLVGKKDYEEIPHYGKRFSVAIMPWNKNRWIAACNPIKLKEYLALGKPIVSTPFRELCNYDGLVYTAQDSRQFADQIRRALREDSPEKIAARRNRVREHAWDKKAQTLVECLESSGAIQC